MKHWVWILFAGAVFAQNWPSFRGPRASGIADGQKPPVKWDVPQSVNVAWKTPIPGLAHSGPVVWGDRIFVTTAISSDPKAKFRWGLYGDVEPSEDLSKHTWKVYCLDRKTGKILWEQTAHEGIPRTKRHPKNSQASATPATDGKYVVASFGSQGLYVYDTSGKLLWKKDLGTLNAGWFFDPDFEWGAASSPVIYRNTVIVQCDIQKNSFLAAFDLKDGREVWRTARPEIPSWGTPTVWEGKGGPQVITNGTKAVRGYDPETGKQLWQLSPNSEVTATTPVGANDLIFIANGYPPIQPIYAIRPSARGDISLKDGQESSEHVAWSKKRGGPYMPTALVYGEHLYLCSNNGILSCYRAATGERVYQQRISEKGGSYSASPVAADGRIYFASEDGDVHVVKAGPEFERLATNPVGEVMMATPAIAPGMIVLRTEHQVIAVADKEK